MTPASTGRLVGVGVGPGDPELVTVKALRVLTEADAVFVPVAADGQTGYAERVVRANLGELDVRPLTFALGADDPASRERDWDAAGAQVAAVTATGGVAAFATIGDPNLYSTFTYLAATVRRLDPALAVETVPGITALQDLAARAGVVLAEGTQRIALLPFTAGDEHVSAALDTVDTVVLYKGGRHLPRIRQLLAGAGRLDDAVVGARLGLDGELIAAVADTDVDATAPYLSTVVATRPVGERGAQL